MLAHRNDSCQRILKFFSNCMLRGDPGPAKATALVSSPHGVVDPRPQTGFLEMKDRVLGGWSGTRKLFRPVQLPSRSRWSSRRLVCPPFGHFDQAPWRSTPPEIHVRSAIFRCQLTRHPAIQHQTNHLQVTIDRRYQYAIIVSSSRHRLSVPSEPCSPATWSL